MFLLSLSLWDPLALPGRREVPAWRSPKVEPPCSALDLLPVCHWNFDRNDGAVVSVERKFSRQLKLQYADKTGQTKTYTNTPKG